MAMTIDVGGPGALPDPPPLVWGTQPWREDPWRAVLGLLGTLALSALAFVLLWSARGGPMIGTALSCAGGAALGHVVFPTRFRVDASGVAARRFWRWRLLTWSSIRRAAVRNVRGGGYALVSPDPRPTVWEAVRGIVVAVPERHPEHDRILAELRRRFAAHGL